MHLIGIRCKVGVWVLGGVPQFSSYCDYVAGLDGSSHHRRYHDTEYGFPQSDDAVFFERLILEINQAGLNWDIILRKRDAFKKAYAGFDIATVAAFTEPDIERLLSDAGIIRNRMKINAAIHNANVILGLQGEHGSFKNWIDAAHPLSKAEWVKLFKKTFKFTGGEIVGEFLMSLGYLPDAHAPSCPCYQTILQLQPMWLVSPLQS